MDSLNVLFQGELLAISVLSGAAGGGGGVRAFSRRAAEKPSSVGAAVGD